MKREIRIPGLRRLIRLPENARSVEREVEEELGFHLSERIAELVAGGVSDAEARAIAEKEFGSVAESRRELIAVDRTRVTRGRRAARWEALGHDLRYALRGLVRRPGLAVVTTVTLALGIGANAVMFGILDRLLVRPPSGIAAPERVRRLYFGDRPGAADWSGSPITTYHVLAALRDNTASFATIGGFFPVSYSLGRGPEAREVDVTLVSGNYFELLGVRAARGRFFAADEDIPGQPVRVAVLSHRFWQSHFGAAEDAVGRDITLDSEPFTVIGVAAPEFTGGELQNVDLWVPISALADKNFGVGWTTGSNAWWVRLVARLRPGVSPEQFSAAATPVYRRVVQSWNQPWHDTTNVVITSSIHPSRGPRGTTLEGRVALWLMGVSVVVLLVACANVANLLIARALQRRREIAVRVALGVSRGRLVRQLATEALLLAGLATATALLVAQWGGRVVRQLLLPGMVWSGGAIDRRVLGFTALVMVITALLAGLAPVLHAIRSDVVVGLRSGTRDAGAARGTLRTALLIAQAALSVVLLVGAGLFVRSLSRVHEIDAGLDLDRVVRVSMELRRAGFDRTRSAEIFRAAHARMSAIPGVERSSLLAYSSPMGVGNAIAVRPRGLDTLPDLPRGGPYFSAVDAAFLPTLGASVLEGRGFTADDFDGPARVMLINEVLARYYWPGRDPVGDCARLRGEQTCTTVVGVVENVMHWGVLDERLPMVYLPQTHPLVAGAAPSALLVRTRGDDPAVIQVIRREIQALAPGMPFVQVQRYRDLVAPEVRPWRLGATMFGVFGAVALIIAAVGLYSVMAYSVSQRQFEIGVRFAVGARHADIVRLVVGHTARVIGVGLVLGILLALVAARWVEPLLHETEPRDPQIYLGVALVLAIAALVASLVPIRRSTRVDPVVALRAD